VAKIRKKMCTRKEWKNKLLSNKVEFIREIFTNNGSANNEIDERNFC
jgi:hypothetical protein